MRHLLNSSIRFEKCILYFLCDVPESGRVCSISYSSDPSYDNLSAPSQVPINIPSSLLLQYSSTIYYYEVSHAFNKSITLQFRNHFRTIKCKFITTLLHHAECGVPIAILEPVLQQFTLPGTGPRLICLCCIFAILLSYLNNNAMIKPTRPENNSLLLDGTTES